MRPDDGLLRVDRELRIDPARRLALLEEIGADLDALAESLRRSGLGPAAARAEAARRLLPDPEVLSELEVEHGGGRNRSAPVAWLQRWERAAVVLLAGAITGWLGWAAVRGGVRVANPFVWLQLALAMLMTAGWARTGLGLWLGSDLRSEDRRRQAGRHGALLLAAFAAGSVGTALEVYGLVRLAAPGAPAAALWGAVGGIASMAALTVAVPVLGLLMWLSLTPRLVRYERLEARIRRIFHIPRLRIEHGAR